ncbi:hypothetical protein C3L33_00152, partial [Rhododendron williamsianum]
MEGNSSQHNKIEVGQVVFERGDGAGIEASQAVVAAGTGGYWGSSRPLVVVATGWRWELSVVVGEIWERKERRKKGCEKREEDGGDYKLNKKKYSADVYDRIWFPVNPSFSWEAFRASSYRNTDALTANDYKPPYQVMATAVMPVDGSNSLDFWFEVDYPKLYNVYMHFAEIGTAEQERELDIYINDAPWSLGVATDFSRPVTVNGTYSLGADSLSFSIRATSQSTLPPILNALEIYEVLELQSPTPTHQSECELPLINSYSYLFISAFST